MKHSNYALPLIFSACLLLCLNAFTWDKRPCIKGEGTAVTENRDITGVGQVSLQSAAHVNITRGDQYACNVSAQKNILDNLIFTREGDKLVISERNCVKDRPDITINMTLPSLTMVGVGGSGDIRVSGVFHVPAFEAVLSGSGNIRIRDSIIAGSLVTEISGSGDISLPGAFKKAESNISGSGSISISGSCDHNKIHISGSGKIHAFGFRTLSTEISTSGSGDSEVNASNTLDVTIVGSGNVWYQGNPAVTRRISGSGSVSKKSAGQ